MPLTRVCPKCGASLPQEGWEGLCPKCLVRVALEDSSRKIDAEHASSDQPAGQRAEGEGPLSSNQVADPKSPIESHRIHYVGDYELLEEIARGGMGVVYRARQFSLNRIVAVKMMLSGQFASTAAVQRFRAEAESAANLHHPNIVAIHEVGEHDGQPYFSMDYVEGQDLGELVRERPLGAHQAARYLKTIAEAIHYAHQRGTLHRDLKPSNVLIDANDQPRITDFGLAKRFVEPEVESQAAGATPVPAVRAAASRIDPRLDLTLTGQVLGSPSFMSPEQASGQRSRIGSATDIYSLGAILYHLVTGRPPFLADTLAETLQQVQHTNASSPRLLNPAVARDLDTICMKCLEKEPRPRYATAQDLADELGRFLQGEPIRARPVGHLEKTWRWCRRNPTVSSLTAGIVLLLVTLAVASPIAAYRINHERQRAEQNAKKEEQQRRSAEASLVRQYVANGNRLVEEGDLFGSLPWLVKAMQLEEHDPLRADIHRLRLASTLRQCPQLVHFWWHKDKVNDAEFSPDGLRVVSAGEDGIARVWDATTGALITDAIRHTSPIVQAKFSPDGQWVLTASHGSARVWNAITGEPRTPRLAHRARVNHTEFSPDGRWVVSASEDGTARLWDAATGNPVAPPLQHRSEVLRAVFSPDGTLVATVSRDETAMVWNAATGEPAAPALMPRSHGEFTDVAFSPNGNRVATGDVGGRTLLWSPTNGALIVCGAMGNYQVTRVAFSPDGRRVVTAYGNGTIRVWDAANGTQLLSVVGQRLAVVDVSFSPDGRRLLTAGLDGTARLWDAFSGEPVAPPLKHGRAILRAAFSPDGRQVVTAGEDEAVRVWDLSGGEHLVPAPEHGNVVHSVAFAPDGRRAITVSLDGTACLCDLALSTSTSSRLTNFGSVRHAQFSADSQRVAVAGSDGTARVWDLATGQLASPPLQHPGPVNYVEYSPDGQRLVTAGADGFARVWEVASGKLLSRMKHSGPLHKASFTPDGARVVTATVTVPMMLAVGTLPTTAIEHLTADPRKGLTAKLAQIGLWEAETGRPIRSTLRSTNEVSTTIFSPDRRYFVSSCSLGGAGILKVSIFEIATGKDVTAAFADDLGVRYAAFSEDGTRILTVSRAVARVWDALTLKPTCPPLVHRWTISHASFSPDGRLIATASHDQTVRVWDAVTGEPVTPPLKHGLDVVRAFFCPGAGRLLTTTSDGNVHLWDLPKENHSPQDGWLLAQLLAVQQFDESGALVSPTPQAAQRAWETLRDKYPADFAARPQQLAVWERREAAERALTRAREHKEHAADLVDKRQWKEAIDEFSKAIADDPEDFELYYKRGVAFTMNNQLQPAIDDYKTALQRAPVARNVTNIVADLHYKLGQHYQRLEDYDQAAAQYGQALELIPTLHSPVSGLSDIAWIYAMGPLRFRSPAKALPLVQAAAKYEPGHHGHQSTLGIVYYRVGQLDQAKQTLLNCIQTHQSGGDGFEFFFLAMCYQRLGERAQANDYYRKATNWLEQHTPSLSPQEHDDLETIRAEAKQTLKEGQ